MNRFSIEKVIVSFAMIFSLLPSIEAKRLYNDAVLLGIMQGNPKEVREDASLLYYSAGFSDLDGSYTSVYKFGSDGQLISWEGYVPYELKRDDMGRIVKFKFAEKVRDYSDQEVIFDNEYTIEWDDANPNKIKRMIHLRPYKYDLSGYSHTTKTFIYGNVPGDQRGKNDQYIAGKNSAVVNTDKNGKNNPRINGEDTFYTHYQYDKIKFDEKGNMCKYQDDGYPYYCEYERSITYYPDEANNSGRLTNANYKDAVREMASFLRHPFGYDIDLKKSSPSAQKTVIPLVKHLKSKRIAYNRKENFKNYWPEEIEISSPIDIFGANAKALFTIYGTDRNSDKKMKKYWDAYTKLELKFSGSLYEMLALAERIKMLFDENKIREWQGTKGKNLKSEYSYYKAKDYFYVYSSHDLDEKSMYSIGKKSLLEPGILMYIPRTGTLENSTLTLLINYSIRKY